VEEKSENVEAERVITVKVGIPEVARMDDLVGAPEFHFRDRADFVRAALLSFLNYKEKELYSIRRGERWR
jgi:Arc/MetJ-type ribon-helix-helix transcriptional regulator